jgi:hypothetical protein
VQEKGKPYGEARRLRYFVIMGCELLKTSSVDVDLFIDKLLVTTERLNPELDKYIRCTGIVKSRRVAMNYLEFADWLGLLRIDGRIVIPNSYTVFLANLDGRWDFFLSEKEKLAFFLQLIEEKGFKRLINFLRSNRINNSIKEAVAVLGESEHYVESYFEWLVDLGLFKPTKPRFGEFCLSNIGYKLCEANEDGQDICKKYAELLLNTQISEYLAVSDDDLWKTFLISVDKLGFYARSELDPCLYSAYPLILDLQIQLVFENHCLLSSVDIVKKLNSMSSYYNAVFNWDNLSKSGYLKLQRR